MGKLCPGVSQRQLRQTVAVLLSQLSIPGSTQVSSSASVQHLFEGNPVDEGTTQRGTDTLMHRPEKPAGGALSSQPRPKPAARQPVGS